MKKSRKRQLWLITIILIIIVVYYSLKTLFEADKENTTLIKDGYKVLILILIYQVISWLIIGITAYNKKLKKPKEESGLMYHFIWGLKIVFIINVVAIPLFSLYFNYILVSIYSLAVTVTAAIISANLWGLREELME